MVSLPVVLLIFISSSSDPIGKLKEGISETSTMRPERGFVDSGKTEKSLRPQVNDLTAADFKFPDERSAKRILENKNIILDKIVPNDKNEKKSPIPLYSLVKNDCIEGYALDENGICQKTITARKGKTRRLDLEQPLRYRKVSDVFVRDGFRQIPVECSKLYPGMVPNGEGGCMILENVPKSTF